MLVIYLQVHFHGCHCGNLRSIFGSKDSYLHNISRVIQMDYLCLEESRWSFIFILKKATVLYWFCINFLINIMCSLPTDPLLSLNLETIYTKAQAKPSKLYMSLIAEKKLTFSLLRLYSYTQRFHSKYWKLADYAQRLQQYSRHTPSKNACFDGDLRSKPSS